MADLTECCCHCHEQCTKAVELLQGLKLDCEESQKVVDEVVELLSDCCDCCEEAHPPLTKQ